MYDCSNFIPISNITCKTNINRCTHRYPGLFNFLEKSPTCFINCQTNSLV